MVASGFGMQILGFVYCFGFVEVLVVSWWFGDFVFVLVFGLVVYGSFCFICLLYFGIGLLMFYVWVLVES